MPIPVPVGLIVPAVRAVIRISIAGDRAVAQYVRDKESFVSGLDVTSLQFITDGQKIAAAFQHSEVQAALANSAQLRELRQRFLADPNNEKLQEEVKSELLAIRDVEGVPGLSTSAAYEIEISASVAQWRKTEEPLRPWERFAMSFADIALEFVGSNPSVLGIGGNAEKIIGALALRISDTIDDDGNFGSRAHFGERVLATVLRAGLQTAATHPDLIFDEEHLQHFIKETTVPIIKAFPAEGESLQEQTNWHNVVDALLGPAASAAFEVVASDPKAFLGKTFDSEKAVGAVTQALMKSAAKAGLAELGKKESLIALYKAALGVAATRPELFLGEADDAREEFVTELFSRTAGVLKEAGPKFDSDLGIELASVGLDALRSNIHIFVKPTGEKPWDTVLQGMVGQVIAGIETGIKEDGKFEELLTTDQLIEFARIFFVQVSKTPNMISRDDSKELNAIVSGVARAMAQDDGLLLTGDAWLEIVAVAAEEAAANPGRLFGFDDSSPEERVAEHLIQNLLKAASEDIRHGRPGGGVLFGDTLKTAIITTLRGVAGNLLAAKATLPKDKVLKLAEEVSRRVRTKGQNDVSFDLGSKEWLAIYRSLLADMLTTGVIPSLTDDLGKPTEQGEKIIEAILAEG